MTFADLFKWISSPEFQLSHWLIEMNFSEGFYDQDLPVGRYWRRLANIKKLFSKGAVGDVEFSTSCKSGCFDSDALGRRKDDGVYKGKKKKNNGQSCEQGVITMSDTIW